MNDYKLLQFAYQYKYYFKGYLLEELWDLNQYELQEIRDWYIKEIDILKKSGLYYTTGALTIESKLKIIEIVLGKVQEIVEAL